MGTFIHRNHISGCLELAEQELMSSESRVNFEFGSDKCCIITWMIFVIVMNRLKPSNSSFSSFMALLSATSFTHRQLQSANVKWEILGINYYKVLNCIGLYVAK